MYEIATHGAPISVMTLAWLVLCHPLPGRATTHGEPPPDANIAELTRAVWTLISEVERDFPASHDAGVLQGMMFRQLGDHTRARRAWQAILDQDPQHVEALSHLGMTALEMEQYEQAVACWQRALAVDPAFPGLHQDIGFALLEAGRYRDAVESLLQALMRTPSSSRALDLLGQCYVQLKDYPRARDAYRRAIQSDPRNAAACYGLMTVSMRLQDFREADAYRARFKALTQEGAHLMRGGYSKQQDLTAMRAGAAALILRASDIYRRHGRNPRATRLLDRASQLDAAQVIGALKQQAAACQTRQQYAQALALVSELTRLEPDQADTHLALGMLALKTRNPAQAQAAFERVIRLAPQRPEGHRELARLYLHLGLRPQQALERAQNAVALAGTAEDYYVLSAAHRVLQQIPEALSAMQAALDRDPDNPLYQQGYDFLQSPSAR